MTRTFIFSFGNLPNTIYINNGNRQEGRAIPSAIAEKIRADQFQNVRSLRIGPNGEWFSIHRPIGTSMMLLGEADLSVARSLPVGESARFSFNVYGSK